MTPPPRVMDAVLQEEGGEQGSQDTMTISSNMQIDMQESLTHGAALDSSWQTIDLIEDVRRRLQDLTPKRSLYEYAIAFQTTHFRFNHVYKHN